MDQVMAGHAPVRCPRCGTRHIGGRDFQSGVYDRGGRFVRLHLPHYTMVCLAPGCGYSAVVYFGSSEEVRGRAARDGPG